MIISWILRFGGASLVVLLLTTVARSQSETQYQASADRMHPDEREVIETLLRLKVSCNVTEDGHLQTFGSNFHHPLPPRTLRYIDGMPRLWALGVERATDEIMQPLADIRLPGLKSIGLSGSNVTDVTIHHFTRFPTLNALNLSRIHITNDGIKSLGKLPELYLLRLNGTVITDSGLKHLVGLKKFGHLEVEDTAITDDGLRWIGQMEKVHTLYLRGTKITDEGIAHLRHMKSLRALALDRTAITDRGLGTLAEFPALQQIEHLYLSDTNVSDRGMEHLDSLPNLKGVSLDGTRVTKATVARIKARPKVYWITGGR